MLCFFTILIVKKPEVIMTICRPDCIVKDAAASVKMEKSPAFLYMRDYFTTRFLAYS